MTAITDLQAWLDSAGGHAFQAMHGSRPQALAALIDQDRAMRQAAWDLNSARERDGLRPLPADEALNAVRPPDGPQVAGTADQVRRQFRDPGWRIRVGDDDGDSLPVHWEPRSAAMIDAIRAARGQGPLAQ